VGFEFLEIAAVLRLEDLQTGEGDETGDHDPG
jgi:hypothetical protein